VNGTLSKQQQAASRIAAAIDGLSIGVPQKTAAAS
jgi:hypothetical protein